MTDSMMQIVWVPVIGFILSMRYAIVLLTTKNPDIILNKNNPQVLKDREKYAVEGGKAILVLAATCLAHVLLLFLDVYTALAALAAGFAIFCILWMKVSKKYGPIG